MMHPDQIYTVQQLRHEDLQAEVEQARVRRECAGSRTAWDRIWLATTWLQHLGADWMRGATQPGSN